METNLMPKSILYYMVLPYEKTFSLFPLNIVFRRIAPLQLYQIIHCFSERKKEATAEGAE